MLRRINVKAFGLSLGIVSAVVVFLLGFLSSFGYAGELVTFLEGIYPGFEPTLPGSFIGALWAFVGAFVIGISFASLYNKFLKLG
ncbi:hypothetical protein COV42_00695 [Candidatus Campbellbacteria bacterium CG11_big_fil_rev_8_21_14_0_20_44_21]|uniref:Uncharacterized protein n=1 Tax=Candidatus Campbellbacteria bacterium CG22_combo_CG10-13_8_21_14_all_43_18 TaxID=1974530 RepID=A0A2H0DX32_9BACT|nr:MAG: hypothetical protein COW82_00350 [Candidatus Campbellbacteria bacterium CG22_combo_CG10-13_8_21_14_all_43_18]PIR24424.1 MAG: hypothetical protein COV42_00695 [Candidatus Campbellbacteria bacterium CG11_big_fil_rev_8_21_14_0_20_44_21]